MSALVAFAAGLLVAFGVVVVWNRLLWALSDRLAIWMLDVVGGER